MIIDNGERKCLRRGPGVPRGALKRRCYRLWASLRTGPALRLDIAPDAMVLARIDRAAENARETQMRASARVDAV